MIATAAQYTSNPSANQQPRASAKTRQRRPWSPDKNDHLVYQWVKFEGQTQGWVAQQLNISQTTVSRIVQRYERWQAHAQPGADGRLDPAERLRAQRWLTYERNELILASALRIAGEMEGFVDVAKSTIRRPAATNKESEVRTENASVDRSGVAARFLRLAFRINMEQLKLAEMEPLAPLPPLSADQIDDEERAAVAARQEIENARRGDDEQIAAEALETNEALAEKDETRAEAPPLKLHNVHNYSDAEIGASAELACCSAPFSETEKSLDDGSSRPLAPSEAGGRNGRRLVRSVLRNRKPKRSAAPSRREGATMVGAPCQGQ